MSANPDTAIRDRAIQWHLRLQTADDTEWSAFAQWLEEDPRHNDAYEMVADADEELSITLPHLERETTRIEANENELAAEFELVESGPRSMLSRYRWSAMAASVAVASLLGIAVLQSGPDLYEISTANGETRVVSLDGGSQIALNGGTRITLDRENARFAQLDQGEAHFTVSHNPADPFTVHVAGQEIVDVGTIFNVVHAKDTISVGVVEGAVQYRGNSTRLTLQQGETLSVAPDGSLSQSRRDASAIGGWTRDMLQYDGASYQMLADDLQRSLGIPVSLDSGMAGRSVTGVIQTDGNQVAVRKRMELLLGVTIEVTPEGWKIKP